MKKSTRKIIIGVAVGGAVVATAGAIGYAVGAKNGCDVCNKFFNSDDHLHYIAAKFLNEAMTKVTVNDPTIGTLDLYAFNNAVEKAGGADMVAAALAGITSPVEV